MIRVELHEDAKMKEKETSERMTMRSGERQRETGMGGGYLRMNE